VTALILAKCIAWVKACVGAAKADPARAAAVFLGVGVFLSLILAAMCRPSAAVRDAVKVEAHTAVVQHAETAAVVERAAVRTEATRTVRHVVTRREERRPDGATVLMVTTADEEAGAAARTAADSVVTSAATVDTRATVDRKEERTHEVVPAPRWRLHADARWNALDLRPVPELNLDLTRRLGPFGAGVWARPDVAAARAGKLRGAAGVLLSLDLGW